MHDNLIVACTASDLTEILLCQEHYLCTLAVGESLLPGWLMELSLHA